MTLSCPKRYKLPWFLRGWFLRGSMKTGEDTYLLMYRKTNVKKKGN